MKKVLIVEDEKPLQQALAEKFEKMGFEVSVASDGKEGIIQAAKVNPNFIVLDVIMPVMDGITTLRHLKELPATKNIPVALLTVLSEEVPESLHNNSKLFDDTVGYWRKDEHNLSEIVKMVQEYLNKNIK